DTEFRSVAYDPLTNDILGGSQDNDVEAQSVALGGITWTALLLGPRNHPGQPDDGQLDYIVGDGYSQAVDATSTPNVSIRYSMTNTFHDFYRTEFDSHDVQINIGNTSNTSDSRLLVRKNYLAATVMLASSPTGAWLSGLTAADRDFAGPGMIPLALNAV